MIELQLRKSMYRSIEGYTIATSLMPLVGNLNPVNGLREIGGAEESFAEPIFSSHDRPARKTSERDIFN